MSQKIKTLLIIAGVAAICIGGYILFNQYQDSRLINESKKLAQSELKIKQYQQELKLLQIEKDSISSHNNELKAVVEFQKNNPTVIIQKYEKSHITIDQLNALNSVELFTRNLARYENFRERYRLSRFTTNH